MNKAMGKSCGVRLLAICVVVTLLAGGAVADGTIYIGTGKGNNGDIVVSVDNSDGVIHSVEVVSHSETPGICDKPIAEIPAAICAANSPDVDTITSATNTSKGIIAAVKDALAQAGVGTTYTGTGKGNTGDIVVNVDYSDGVLHSVLCAEGENTCERRKGAERSL